MEPTRKNRSTTSDGPDEQWAIERALNTAQSRGVKGKDITKHVMRSIDDATEYKTRRANGTAARLGDI